MKTASLHRRTIRPSKKNRQTGHSRIGGNGGNAKATTKDGHFQVSASLNSWLTSKKNNLINGKWVPAASGKTFDVFNPADGSVIARVPDSDREDINRAVAAAGRAFE